MNLLNSLNPKNLLSVNNNPLTSLLNPVALIKPPSSGSSGSSSILNPFSFLTGSSKPSSSGSSSVSSIIKPVSTITKPVTSIIKPI